MGNLFFGLVAITVTIARVGSRRASDQRDGLKEVPVPSRSNDYGPNCVADKLVV